jgi:hypothetical protein
VQEAVKERVIKRQNFGTIFRYQQPLYTYTDTYTHHLILDLPPRSINATSQLVQQAHPSVMNQQFSEFLHNLYLSTTDPVQYAIRQEVLHIQHLVDAIYDLFVEFDRSDMSSRKRRYWCVFYCSDVATQTDLEIVQQYNKNSSNITAQNFEKLKKSITAMASFSQIVSKKFDAHKYIIERQQLNQQIGEKATKSTQVLVGTLVNLFLPNALHLVNLHNSLIRLKHNILTFDVLPYAHARSVMNNIKQHVAQWPLRFLVNPDPLSLYKKADISYFRTSSNLHIGLRVKVSYFRKPLHLFKVEKFELGIPIKSMEV